MNRQWLGYDCTGAGIYLFVLAGQKIDRAFYDNLNAYTDETGSDGVIRKGLNKPELDGKFGIRIVARPRSGFAYYTVAEHRGTLTELKRYFEAN